jgi:hypothetical protein
MRVNGEGAAPYTKLLGINRANAFSHANLTHNSNHYTPRHLVGNETVVAIQIFEFMIHKSLILDMHARFSKIDRSRDLF